MLFQPINDKRFAGVYANGKVHTDSLPEGLSQTWRYCPYLGDMDIAYAYLYCTGCTLDDACPQSIHSEWIEVTNKLKAHLAACQEAKINMSEVSLVDLVPFDLLQRFFDLKNMITGHVLDNYPKPENYDFLLDLEKMLCEIRQKKINFDLHELKTHLTTTHARLMYKRMRDISRYIDYDPFKVKTGRLTTKRGSFPILTMSKEFRNGIKPNNDCFVELDFNAAELRTFLALAGEEQPQGDIHEWNAQNVYKGMITRDEAKKRIFAWLYNPSSTDKLSAGAYDREAVVKKYFNGSQVSTFFDRNISADNHHALNYIIQSTTSDLFLRQAIKINKLLKDKKSYIAFTLHDSLVIDCVEGDMPIIRELVEVFRDTPLGKFVVNISIGNSYGNMQRLKL